MSKFGMIGASYTAKSNAVADEETINFYPETIESAGAQTQRSFFGTPGLKVFVTLPQGPTRGQCWTGDRQFTAAGDSLYEVFADGTFIARMDGTLDEFGGPVSIAFSNIELFIVAGGRGYCYNLAANTFNDVTALLAGAPAKVEFSDDYFIVMFAGNNKFQMSGILDGNTWPGIQVNGVSVFPENIVSIIVSHRELWVFGSQHAQPYQNTGTDEVFDVIPGALIETGCAATFGPCLLDNTVFWISQDIRGGRQAWRANGYTPSRISTHAVEAALSSYSADQISNLVTYAYQDGGHLFWMLYIPGTDCTWVYDVAESLWHKRAEWLNGGGAGSTVFSNASGQLWQLWGPPDPPFPPSAGQSVAWSFPTQHTAPDIMTGSFPFNQSGLGTSSLTTGALALLNGKPGFDNSISQGWLDFAMPPEIPAGATIVQVVPVVIVSVLKPGGNMSLHCTPTIPDGAIFFTIEEGYNFAHASEIRALEGMVISATIQNSTVGDVSLAIGISFVGAAVYYTDPANPTGGAKSKNQATWSDFALDRDDLPSDASIQGIYAVLVANATFDAAVQSLSWAPDGTIDLPFVATPISPGQTFADTVFHSSTNIGTDLAILPALSITASVGPASGFLENLSDYMDVTAVGFAIYYTSANPVIDPDMPPPFAVPDGQGLIWAVPGTETDNQNPVGGLVKITSSTVMPIPMDPSPTTSAVLFGYDSSRPAKGPLFGVDPLTVTSIAVAGTTSLSGALNTRFSVEHVTGAETGPVLFPGGPAQPPFTFYCVLITDALTSSLTAEAGIATTASTGAPSYGAVQGFPAASTFIPPVGSNGVAVYGPHRSWNHTYAFGKHLVGDWQSGNLNEMSLNFLDDNGELIRRLRRSPTLVNEMSWVYHAELTVDFATGLGPQPPLTDGDGNPRPPQAMLRWSNNRGFTWSNQHIADCGFAGEYNKRVIWRRLGRSRYRVYEVTVSDPISWTIVDAYLKAT